MHSKNLLVSSKGFALVATTDSKAAFAHWVVKAKEVWGCSTSSTVMKLSSRSENLFVVLLLKFITD